MTQNGVDKEDTGRCNGRMATELTQYLKELDDDGREQLAVACKTTVGHLRNVGYGCSTCHPTLASRIWRHSKGHVSRESLCPDDYWEIWPDLKPPKSAKKKAA